MADDERTLTDREVDTPDEAEEARERRSPSGRVVYDAVVQEAEEELQRPGRALFWSAVAAGLSMGFSLFAEGLLRHHLPDTQWKPLVTKLGYSVGFLVVILGRQQLFTENTLTPVLPLLKRRDLPTLGAVGRLWGLVLSGNLIGAMIVAGLAMHTPTFDADIRQEFIDLARHTTDHEFARSVMKGVFAGWLIALIVWMLPYAESAHFWVILTITWLVGVGGFNHVVAGAVDGFVLTWVGERGWIDMMAGFLLPTLIGNVIGGCTFVAALSHVQVASDEASHAEGDSDDKSKKKL